MSITTLSIPEITEDRLQELGAKILPLVKSGDKLFWIVIPHFCNVAFTWDPKLRDEAEGLVEIAQIRTLHTFGYHGFFKPSVAEVLSQIPYQWIEQAVGFSTVGPSNLSEMNQEREAGNAGFHVATTTLYGLLEP